MAVNYNQILPSTSCFQLVRSNPKLTGNVKLTVDSTGALWLNSINANSELAKAKYKKYALDTSKSHSAQVFNFFGSNPQPGIVYDLELQVDDMSMATQYEQQYDFSNYFSGAKYADSQYYNEKFSYFAPLYLNTQIPEFFVIFKLAGAANYNVGTSRNNYPFVPQKYFNDMFLGAQIVATFDMRGTAVLGQYLNAIITDPMLPSAPLQVSFQPGQFTQFCGISLNSGTYAAIGEDLSKFFASAQPITGFENYITGGFQRNLVLHPYIINMEFMFDDATANDYDINRYFGLYCNLIELQQLTLDINRYLDRSANTNVPSLRKPYSLTDETSLLQTNTAGVDILVTGTQMTGLDQYTQQNFFFPYLLDKNDDIYIVQQGSVQTDSIADRTKFKVTTESLDLGQLFGPSELFIQDTAQSVQLQGQSFVEMDFTAAPVHLDRFRIYHIAGSQQDSNGTFDDVVAIGANDWSELPSTGDFYAFYDYQNNLGDKFYFNATGTLTQVVATMTNCINAIRNKGFTAYAYGTRLFIKANTPGFYDTRFSVLLNCSASTYSSVTVNGLTGASALAQQQIFFQGGSTGFQLLIDHAHFPAVQQYMSDLLVMTNTGWSNITAISKYASIITAENAQSPVLVAEALEQYDSLMSIHVEAEQIPTVLYTLGFIRKQFFPRTGVLSFFEIRDFSFDRLASTYSNYPDMDLYKEFFVPPGRNLLNTNSVAYRVIGVGQISVNGVTYNPGDILSNLGNGLEYSVVSGDCSVIVAQGFDPNDPQGGLPLTQQLYDGNGEMGNFSGFASLKAQQAVQNASTSDLYVYRDKFVNGYIPSEYDFANENDASIYATTSMIIPYITKWGLVNGTDVRDNAYRLNTDLAFGVNNFAPDHFSAVTSPNNFSHEWFYIESDFNYTTDRQTLLDNLYYFNTPFNISVTDKTDSALFNQLGFEDFFIYTPTLNGTEIGPTQFRYSPIVQGTDGVYRAFFKGVTYVFREISGLGTTLANGKPTFIESSTRFQNYKFSVLLKTKKEDFLGEDPITYRFVEHIEFQWIVLVITLKVSSLDQIDSNQLTSVVATNPTPPPPFVLSMPTPGYDDIYGDYRLAFDANGVSNIDYAFLYYAQNKKYNELKNSFSTTALGNKIDFSTTGVVALASDFSIARQPKGYFIDLTDEIFTPSASALNPTATPPIIDDYYLYLKSEDESFLLQRITGNQGTPLITSVQIDKFLVDSVYNLALNGIDSSSGLQYNIPSSSAGFWSNFGLFQFRGGSGYYEHLFKYLSFGYVKNLINGMGSNVQYVSYDYTDQNIVSNSNEIYVEIADPQQLSKNQVVTSQPDLILDVAISQSSDVPKQVGYTLFTNPVTNYTLNRYSGGYDAIFNQIAFFESETTVQNTDLSFANVVFNTNYANIFTIGNFNHVKVSDHQILSLANDPKYSEVYPLVGEVAIGQAPYFLLSSNWEWGFHHYYSDKFTSRPVSGTLRVGEDQSFIGKLVNMPENVYLQNFTFAEENLASLNSDYSKVQVVYQENPQNFTGVINLANVAVSYFASTALTANISKTFVDVNGNPITQNSDYLGNLTLAQYISEYISGNLLPLYRITAVNVYTLTTKGTTSAQAGTSGNNPNTIQFVNLTNSQIAALGYTLTKDIQINNLGQFLLGFTINKPSNSSLSVALSIQISLI